jgi:hypothetical protein
LTVAVDFERNLDPKLRVISSEVHAVTASAAPFKDIHRIMRISTTDFVVSAQQRLGSAASKLFVEPTEPLIVAGYADPIRQKRGVPELTESRRERMFDRVRRR